MAWTTPRTWSVNEQLTAALMNEQLRDNLSYLYGNAQLKLATAFSHDEDEQTTTSSTYVDTTVSATITTTLKATLLVIAYAQFRSSNTSYTAYVAIHDGTTQVLARSTTSIGYESGVWGLRVTGRAAGTYTYKFQFKITSGSTARFRLAGLFIIAIPE